MKNTNRITSLTWEYPSFPPRPIKREVLFSLMYEGPQIYFVNDSNEILNKVSANIRGFVGEGSVTNISDRIYIDVKPGESVMLDEYDMLLDSDFTLGLFIDVESNKYGKMSINSKMGKGGVPSQVRMYKDLTTPRMVDITIKEEK